MIYFDNSATTRVDPEVSEAMLPYLHEGYGNPSSKYYELAKHAKLAVENARENVSKLLGCDPDEVVFTSGATESNNTVLKGFLGPCPTERQHLITSKVEHSSILDTAKYLAQYGIQLTLLDVDQFGRVATDTLAEAIQIGEPTMVSIMWGNNEVGSLNAIAELSQVCAERNILFHTDATQVVGKIPIDLRSTHVRFLSCSAHKIHGPKGIGACVVRKHRLGYKTKLTPLLHGGGQESDYRSGTLSVHNIVGFGKAAEIALRDLSDTSRFLEDLESYFIERMKTVPVETIYNSDNKGKVPGILNLRLPGVNNEILIRKLAHQIAMSTGSACSSSKPSHVLTSMGLSLDEVRSSLRISLSKFNTFDEIDDFVELLSL